MPWDPPGCKLDTAPGKFLLGQREAKEAHARMGRVGADLPTKRWSLSNWSSVNFPKRDELSFLTVFALPKDSKRGFDSRMRRMTDLSSPALMSAM